eukprot:8988306-Lingulodinium_polyedra.AAC.1
MVGYGRFHGARVQDEGLKCQRRARSPVSECGRAPPRFGSTAKAQGSARREAGREIEITLG